MPVHADLRQPRRSGWERRDQQGGSRLRERQRECAAGHGNNDALRQDLLDNSPPASSERCPNREFPLAQRGSHKQQVSEVRAGDQEHKPWQPQSAILAVDETTLATIGGMRRIRRPLADGLLLVAAAHPKAVAIDVILTDRGDDPEEDRDLAKAFCLTPHLVLSALLM